LEGAFKPGDTVEVAYRSGQYEFRSVKPARTPQEATA
jgi:hypothetical protein